MVEPGAELDGRYAVLGLLARGGMADVYRAHDVVLDRFVAVKAFRAGTAHAAADARRFERETQLLAGLSHPNLVRLLDAGHHDEAPFLVLELIDGPTLAQRLGLGPLGLARAGQVGLDLARALAEVHAQNVVHRDVKPANVLLAPDGRALLSDFGIAQLADGTRLTATRATIGTAAYLAPEQVNGDVVTGAADVYALGLVLIEALSGQRPFEGTPHEMVVARLVRDPVIPPVVPPSWARLLEAMTRRDPAARPDAATVAEHLAPLAHPHGADDLPGTDEPHPIAPSAATRSAPVPASATASLSAPAAARSAPAPAVASAGRLSTVTAGPGDPVAARSAATSAAAASASGAAAAPATGDATAASAGSASRRWAGPEGLPARLWPLWLGLLVLAVLAAAVLVPGRDGDPSPSESAASGSTTTGAPPTSATTATTATTAASTTAPSTTTPSTSAPPPTSPPPTASTPAAPSAAPVAMSTEPPDAACAELDAQKQALDEQKRQSDDTHRDDREARDALRDQLDDQKDAIEAQKDALGC